MFFTKSGVPELTTDGAPVQMPNALEDREKLKFMKYGEETYTVPWAVYVDDDRRMYIDQSFSKHHTTGGTVQMKVRRAANGFEIWTAGQRYRVGGVHGTVSDKDYVPVVKIHGY